MLPVMIMTAAAIVGQIEPFGANTFLVSDINAQFAAFYTYLKHTVMSNRSMLYTLSKTIGGDMMGFNAYYLNDPIALLLIFVPDVKMSVGIYWMNVLKMGLMGVSCFAFLKSHSLGDCVHVVFSTTYALMGYAVAYLTLPMYFNNLILLPLVIMAVERFIKNPKHFKMYVITIALAIWSNYYLGYMTCIFAGLYFLLCAFCKKECDNVICCFGKGEVDKELNKEVLDGKKKEVKQQKYGIGILRFIRKVLRFAGVSLLGVGLSAFSLIPTVLSLKGEKSSSVTVDNFFGINYGMKYLLKNMIPGTFRCDFSNTAAPYIYVGIIAVVFVLVWIVEGLKRKEYRNIFGKLVLLFILIESTRIKGINVIWHGFNEPVGFAFRYAFLICFMLIMMADEGFSGFVGRMNSGRTDEKNSDVLDEIDSDINSEKENIEDTKNGKIRKDLRIQIVVTILMLLQIMDLSYNAISSVRAYVERDMHDSVKYEEYYAAISEEIEAVKADAEFKADTALSKNESVRKNAVSADETIYRLEKDTEYNHNDAMLFDYAGLSHNSSCEKDYVRLFMARLGFRNQGIWSFYNQGSTTFADALLGVKYFISKYDSTNKPYSEVDNNGIYYTFENPYALPLAFLADEKADGVDMERMNLFELQNELASVTGDVDDIYTKADYCVNLINASETVEKTGGEMYQAALGFDGPNECKLYMPEGEDASEGSYVEYEVHIDNTCNLFGYFAAPGYQDSVLYVNDAPKDVYFCDYRWAVANLGNYEKGDVVKIKLSVPEGGLRIYDAFIYEEDTKKIAAWYENSRNSDVVSEGLVDADLKDASYCGNVRITKSSERKYTAQVVSDELQYFVMSVPYEKGWTIKVDGVKSEAKSMWGALLATKIPKGEHEIELSYFPEGMVVGIIISTAALVILGIYVSGVTFRK